MASATGEPARGFSPIQDRAPGREGRGGARQTLGRPEAQENGPGRRSGRPGSSGLSFCPGCTRALQLLEPTLELPIGLEDG